ncbi:MAG: hypothetical protein IJB82_03545, partial [Bacilli bacterium]|nr:hypothetical protein [Bacilli bacterium]
FDEKIRAIDTELIKMRADDLGFDLDEFKKTDEALLLVQSPIDLGSIRSENTSIKLRLEEIQNLKKEATNKLFKIGTKNLPEIKQYERLALERQLMSLKSEQQELEQRQKLNKLLYSKKLLQNKKEKDIKNKAGKNWEKVVEEIERDKLKRELSALNSREEYLKNSYKSEKTLEDLIVLVGGEKKKVQEDNKEVTPVVTEERKIEDVTPVNPERKIEDVTPEKTVEPAVEKEEQEKNKPVVAPFPTKDDKTKSDKVAEISDFTNPNQKEKEENISFFKKHRDKIIKTVAFLTAGLVGLVGGVILCHALNHFQKDTEAEVQIPVAPIVTVTPEITPEVTPEPEKTPEIEATPEVEIPSADNEHDKPINPSGPSNPSGPTDPSGPTNPTPTPDVPDPTPTPVQESHGAINVEIPTTKEGETTEVSTSIEVDGVVYVKNPQGTWDAYKDGKYVGTAPSNEKGELDDSVAREIANKANENTSENAGPSQEENAGNTEEQEKNEEKPAVTPEPTGEEKGVEEAPEEVQKEIIDQVIQDDLFNQENLQQQQAETFTVGDAVFSIDLNSSNALDVISDSIDAGMQK